MENPGLPKLERGIPAIMVKLMLGFFYLFVIPLSWVLKKLGKSQVLISAIHKRQLPPGGPAAVFKDYQPTASDVFVSTFAKSGTNWMMQIAHQIAFRGKGEYAHIHDVVTWPDINKDMSKRMTIPLTDQQVQQVSPTRLRVIKTHLSALHVPYSDKAHYLVVVRDPKEVLVSSYYFTQASFGPILPPLQEWFEMFLTADFPLNFGNTWAEHTASYWALKHQPNVLILSYTAMKQNLDATVQQVADCLGVKLTNEELAEVVHRSTFDYMSTIDEKFLPVPKGTLPWGDFKMMRQGKTGNSKELITVDQQRQIDRHFQQELARLGSDFPYQEFCNPA